MSELIVHPFYDYEKEEAWLNQKAAQGQALVWYCWIFYRFEPCEPGAWTYRLDYLSHPVWHPKSKEYFSFLREMGIEKVGGWIYWATLRKPAADGPFQLYSDRDSRMRHNLRISRWFGLGALGELLAFLLMLRGILGFHLESCPTFWDTHIFLTALPLLFFALLLRLRHKFRKRALRERKEQQISET